MFPVPWAENITARDGLNLILVLLGGTKDVPNILGLVNLYAIFVENTCALLWPALRTF
nr:unnamed protein product [Callosobruchus analis]